MDDMTFEDLEKVCAELDGRGVSVEDLALADAMRVRIAMAKERECARPAARRRLADDAGALFRLAKGVVKASCGASTPGNAARGIVSAYIMNGLDVMRTAAYVQKSDFGLMCVV